jgi:zinc protease
VPAQNVLRQTLPNGLTVLIKRDASAPVAAVVTHVKAGYFDETDDVAGIAHVLEHMFFKGTPTRGVGEIARETKAQGGYLNAHTIYDHTSYYAVVPSAGFPRALAIQADAYANSLIDAAELGRELEVIIEEAKRKADSPGAVATETLFELLHDRHRIRRWRIGREEGLRRLTRAQLVHFYRNFYRPGNTILSIVGDVPLDETVREVERLYGALPNATIAHEPGEGETSAPGFRYRELSGDIAQTEVAMGWRTPGTLHEDTPLLDLAALVLGTGRASRLYRAVRERQLASSVSAWNYTPSEIGVFVVSTEGDAERARPAATAAWGEVVALRDRGLSAHEMERARRVLESRWLRRLESMDGQATYLAEWEALGGWELGDEVYERSMAATASEVHGAVQRHLDPEQASLLVYRPTSASPFAGSVGEARAQLGGPAPAMETAWALVVDATAVHTGAPAPDHVEGNVRVYRTGNGVPILIRQKPGAPIVHLGVFAAVGGADEPSELAGVALVAGRAALKGTVRRTSAQIAEECELLGGSISASVSNDGTGYTFSVPLPRFAAAVELMADVVQHATHEAPAVETERVLALTQLTQLRDDMYRYPSRLATEVAYAGHPYSRGPLGTEATLAALGTDDVRQWSEAARRGAPWVIAVAGDVEPGAAAGMIAAHFTELTLADRVPLAAPRWPDAVVQRAEEREKAQSALVLAFEGPARRDDARFAARLLAGVASGLGGRFFEQLRDKQSLCYTVQAHPVERVAGGMFVAYIAMSPEKEDAARDGLLREFVRFGDGDVTVEELERAKEYAIGTHAIASQSGGALLGELVDAWMYGRLSELEEFVGRVRGVRACDIRQIATRYFDVSRRAEGIVRGVATR